MKLHYTIIATTKRLDLTKTQKLSMVWRSDVNEKWIDRVLRAIKAIKSQ